MMYKLKNALLGLYWTVHQALHPGPHSYTGAYIRYNCPQCKERVFAYLEGYGDIDLNEEWRPVCDHCGHCLETVSVYITVSHRA